MRAYRHEVDVSLTTKTALSAPELEFLKSSIKLDHLKPKDNIIFNHEVDPSIIEGYKVNISGVTYDLTWNNSIKEQEAFEKDLEKKELDQFNSSVPKYPKVDVREIIKQFHAEEKFFIPPDAWTKFFSC